MALDEASAGFGIPTTIVSAQGASSVQQIAAASPAGAQAKDGS
jgi:hypothetical protein